MQAAEPRYHGVGRVNAANQSIAQSLGQGMLDCLVMRASLVRKDAVASPDVAVASQLSHGKPAVILGQLGISLWREEQITGTNADAASAAPVVKCRRSLTNQCHNVESTMWPSFRTKVSRSIEGICSLLSYPSTTTIVGIAELLLRRRSQ